MCKSVSSFLLVFILLYPVFSSGQLKNKVRNKRTARHVNVPLTRVSIIPPDSFKVSESSMQLIKNKTSLIQIIESEKENFYDYLKNFRRENVAPKGVMVLEFKKIKFNKYDALFTHLKDSTYSNVGLRNYYTLVFGDSSFSCRIIGFANEKDQKTSEEIRNAILSVIYDKHLVVDYMSAAKFIFDPVGTKFELLRPTHHTSFYYYMEKGRKNDSLGTNTIYRVHQSKCDLKEMTPKSIAMDNNAITVKGKRYELPMDSLDYEYTGKVNDYPVYEAADLIEKNGEKVFMYVFVAVRDTRAIVSIGYSKDIVPENLEEFKKLSRTIRIK